MGANSKVGRCVLSRYFPPCTYFLEHLKYAIDVRRLAIPQIVLTTICLLILGAHMNILYMINAKMLVLIIEGPERS